MLTAEPVPAIAWFAPVSSVNVAPIAEAAMPAAAAQVPHFNVDMPGVNEGAHWGAWAQVPSDVFMDNAVSTTGDIISGSQLNADRHHADLVASQPAPSNPSSDVALLHHKTAAQDVPVREFSLPPSEVIRAIKEGSIALRIGQPAVHASEAPLWFLDDASGALQRSDSEEHPEAVRLQVNDDTETETAAVVQATQQLGTAMSLKPSLTLNCYSPSWMQILRDFKNRWL